MRRDSKQLVLPLVKQEVVILSAAYDGPSIDWPDQQRRIIAARKRRDKGQEVTALRGHSYLATYVNPFKEKV